MTERKMFVCVKTDGEGFALGDTITGYLTLLRGLPCITDAKPLKTTKGGAGACMEAYSNVWTPLDGPLWGWEEVK